MEHEKKEIGASALLPLPNLNDLPSREAAGEDKAQDNNASASAPLTFRGEPISWVTVPQNRTIVHANAIGMEDREEQETGVRHLIEYQGKQQKRGEFLKTVFPDYKKYPYKVRFKNDDIFRLGGN